MSVGTRGPAPSSPLLDRGGDDRRPESRGWVRRGGGWLLTGLALAVVWFALVAPNQLDELSGRAFLRLPLELVALTALALLLPARAWRALAVAAGLLLALVSVLKVADMGFLEVLDRPFDPVVDWTYLDSAVGVVDASAGRTAAVGVSVVAGLLALLLLSLTPWALLRLGRLVRAHRRRAWAGAGVAAVAFVLLAVLGTQTVDQLPVASTATSHYVWDEVAAVPSGLADQREFTRAAQTDPLRDVPPDRLFTALRGKDVLLVFVESYGRVAVQDSTIAPGVDAVLDRQSRKLVARGFGARSAFLTSPTFGAVSWLAHSTTQSGLWVDSQRRYDVLVTSPRLTLSRLFGRAGWRTVSDVPADTHDWPQGAFYDYDQKYDQRNVGYEGPKFGYPTIPDQYTLDAFRRLELAPRDRRPVFAEIDLISSHASWSTLPRMIPWSQVGNGSAFAGMPEESPPKSETWQDAAHVQAAYGRSIRYSLRAVYSWMRRYGGEDTVLVVLGDHQPATIVTGEGADHDVPVSVVARDPRVLERIDGWGWQSGVHPGPTAPVWRMDAFRDRFVRAYGP